MGGTRSDDHRAGDAPMIRTFATMGTVASVRLPSGDARLDAVLPSVQAVFAAVDERFSLYRSDSEASRIARGELSLTASSAAMRNRYAEALAWRDATGGAFTPHRPDGVVDLSGVVKAVAIAAAGAVLDAAGIEDWLLNVGGDVLVRGSEGGVPWQAGIVDPADRSALLTALALPAPRRAVATSGIGERGEHIWRRAVPGGQDLVQVTVAAADIVTADVLATAILAGGPATLDDLADRFDIDVLAATHDGVLLATPGLRSGEFSGSLLEPRPDVELPGVEVKGVHQVALSDSISADRQPEEHVRSTI
ncbi:thiamine biosynthesis lipoprotein [Plantibacter flavus]|uniref:FAD:protein FMN transferase n=1 Tax=Plantibacter flavus TaxID=150123 RepID=A0A3N2C740_9MICO|nr:FAD:protein FMN transferase [Plantibacter flavus]ROR83331.1 thiamine biosynthesis lipoprotein [Plantibacter flavus]SMG22610.1 thiamine biosynthesis lipoprotein [Plantibacter flavus]